MFDYTNFDSSYSFTLEIYTVGNPDLKGIVVENFHKNMGIDKIKLVSKMVMTRLIVQPNRQSAQLHKV